MVPVRTRLQRAFVIDHWRSEENDDITIHSIIAVHTRARIELKKCEKKETQTHT